MLLVNSFMIFFISNLCLAAIDNNNKDEKNLVTQTQQCQYVGDQCQENDDCCSELICYSIKKRNVCLPPTSNWRSKRYSDDLMIPPYYNPNNQLYPYGISQPALPFHKTQEIKQTTERKKMEWENCQFHEDCGEGNCCYVHFRFRSLPKWFCRPNRNDADELCEPLTKYRSLKDVPAWKQQKQQEQNQQSQQQR